MSMSLPEKEHRKQQRREPRPLQSCLVR